jgi:hypothetical protein
MKARLKGPLRGISGKFKDNPFVFFMRGNKCCRRYHVAQKDAQSPRQLMHRAHLSAAARHWTHNLTPDQRQAWHD